MKLFFCLYLSLLSVVSLAAEVPYEPLDEFQDSQFQDLFRYLDGDNLELIRLCNTPGEGCLAQRPEQQGCAAGSTVEKHCKIVRWSMNLSKKYRSCNSFIDDQGRIGKNSSLVVQNILFDINEKGRNSSFLQNYTDIEEICPGYSEFDLLGKVEFFAHVFQNLSYREASCNNNVRAQGVNDVAVGMYQMELTPAMRSYRGDNCRQSEKEIQSLEGNTACAVSIMSESLNKKIRSNTQQKENIAGLFGSRLGNGNWEFKSYWHALNPSPDCPEKLKSYQSKIAKGIFVVTPDGDLTDSKGNEVSSGLCLHDKMKIRLGLFPLCKNKK